MLGVLLTCAGLLGAAPPANSDDDLSAYQAAASRAGRDPDAHVKLALWCESHGLDAERLKHLTMALLSDPSHAAARGLMGLVRDGDKWRRPDQVADRIQSDADLAAKLAEYNAKRAKTSKTAEAQWRLALWCEHQGLEAEAKAHLTTVTRLDPSRDAAWKKLGCVSHNGRWMTREQIAAEKANREAQAKADKRWKPLLEKWREELRDKDHRAEAEAALTKITDPRAVPAILKVFGSGNTKDQAQAVLLLGQIDSPGATRALGLLAVLGDSADVRRAASETLRRRDPRDFLSLLIGLVRKPLKYQVKPVGGPGSPGVLFVEGDQYNVQRIYAAPTPPPLRRIFNDSVPFDPYTGTSYWAPPGLVANEAFLTMREQALGTRVAPFGASSFVPNAGANLFAESGGNLTAAGIARDMQIGSNLVQAQRTATASQQQLGQDVARIESYNADVAASNERVLPLLTDLTGQDIGADPAAWQRWWIDEQGLSAAPTSTADKPTITQDVLALPPAWVGVRGQTSCFAGGTSVATRQGRQSIESLEVGDQVIAQNTTTGLLSYLPILAVYHNRPAPTLRIDFGGETIVATGIHRFWKAGRGWTMARDLRPGDAIRTLNGLARVASVKNDRVQPVFNLEVARGQSFFVGKAGALAHDNSTVYPVSQPFDAPPSLAARD